MLQDPFINKKSGLRSFGMLGWGLDNIQNSNKQGPIWDCVANDIFHLSCPGGISVLKISLHLFRLPGISVLSLSLHIFCPAGISVLTLSPGVF